MLFLKMISTLDVNLKSDIRETFDYEVNYCFLLSNRQNKALDKSFHKSRIKLRISKLIQVLNYHL